MILQPYQELDWQSVRPITHAFARVAGLDVRKICGVISSQQDEDYTVKDAISVQYLEIVTTEVEATCTALAAQHGVSFSAPEAMLGNARIAKLDGGGRIGVRAPMRDDEASVVRPYLGVADIEAASKTAEVSGAEFAMRATEIPGQGKFAIYFLGGIQHGLWEL